ANRQTPSESDLHGLINVQRTALPLSLAQTQILFSLPADIQLVDNPAITHFAVAIPKVEDDNFVGLDEGP
ncbi:MAG TPA: hypothetical protein VE863_19215, partial [Pyrinomonadaceae bacterium]|nr:hypothetical protein [Pyrinomonadaceae bacterium]